jgi:hypothetical protein
MKCHHFKALYYCDLCLTEQQYIRDWFVDHRVTKYTGRRYSDEMVIMDEVLIYNLIKYMNRLKNRKTRDAHVDSVIESYATKHCCNKIGTVV